MKSKAKFSWKVLEWDFNSRELEEYDVVPHLLREYMNLKPKDRPKTFEAFNEWLKSECMYRFWAKYEHEILVSGLFDQSKASKIDAYYQLEMNWEQFSRGFWDSIKE